MKGFLEGTNFAWNVSEKFHDHALEIFIYKSLQQLFISSEMPAQNPGKYISDFVLVGLVYLVQFCNANAMAAIYFEYYINYIG